MTAVSLFLLEGLVFDSSASLIMAGCLRCKKLNALQIYQNSVQTWLRWLPNICTNSATQKTRRTQAFLHTAVQILVPHVCIQWQREDAPFGHNTCLLAGCFFFFASLCVSVCLSSLSEGLDIIRCICFYCRVCACIHLCVCERETESEKWRLCLDFSVNFIFYQSVFMQTVMLSRMWAAIQRLGRCLLMN